MMSDMEITRCLRNKEEIVVVGSPDSRRGQWFKKAADQAACPVTYMDWTKVREQKLAPSVFVKLEPPEGLGACFDQFGPFVANYLEDLAYLAQSEGISFLNAPSAILNTLDKVGCKLRLKESGLPQTEMIEEKAATYEELLKLMKGKGICDLFIKPRYGSGSAGILAYRHHPVTGQEVLYTSMKQAVDQKAYNTKQIRRISENREIRWLINRLLTQPVILERWTPKAKFGGIGYDIRAVFQFGKLDFMVARGSTGPMTNLHLNNQAISIEELKLTDQKLGEIESLCREAAGCFPGLSIAGLDILITPSGRLKIIEINGQGDLIYQDIFKENRIYNRQIREGIKRYEREGRSSNPS